MQNVLSENLLSKEDLDCEISAYVQAFCFSNIDVLLQPGKILSLEIEDIYSKVVLQKKGGYCFEHNKLFSFFLSERHIQTKNILARVLYGQNVDKPKTHRATIVNLSGKEYLVDVGFGGHNPNAAIPLNGDAILCPNGKVYRVHLREDGIYTLEQKRKSAFFTLYAFEGLEASEADFELSNYYSNTHPNSKHTQNLVLSRNSGSKTLAVFNGQFLELYGDGKDETKIESSHMLKELLASKFDRTLTENEAQSLFKRFISDKLEAQK